MTKEEIRGRIDTLILALDTPKDINCDNCTERVPSCIEDLDDCKRIVEVFHEHNFEISRSQACDIWIDRSNNWAASWLCMQKDPDGLWLEICHYWADISKDNDDILKCL